MEKTLIWNDLSPELKELIKKKESEMNAGNPIEPNSHSDVPFILRNEDFKYMAEYNQDFTGAEIYFVLGLDNKYKFNYIRFFDDSENDT